MKSILLISVLTLFLGSLAAPVEGRQQYLQDKVELYIPVQYSGNAQNIDLGPIKDDLYLAIEKGIKSVLMISKTVTMIWILLSIIHALLLIDILISKFPYGVKLPWFFLVLLVPVGGPFLYLWSGCKLKIKGDPDIE